MSTRRPLPPDGIGFHCDECGGLILRDDERCPSLCYRCKCDDKEETKP